MQEWDHTQRRGTLNKITSAFKLILVSIKIRTFLRLSFSFLHYLGLLIFSEKISRQIVTHKCTSHSEYQRSYFAIISFKRSQGLNILNINFVAYYQQASNY